MERENKLSEGQDVAHIHNIKQKMTISVIKTETIQQVTGDINKETGEVIKKPRKIIRGVLVHWFVETNTEGIKKLEEHTFHTKELIPWEEAEKGEEAVLDYLEKRDMHKYLNSKV